MRIMIFLDDLILLKQNTQKLMKDLKTVIFILENLEILINWEKSVISPTRVLDTREIKVLIPEDKLGKVVRKYQDTLHREKISVRELA